MVSKRHFVLDCSALHSNAVKSASSSLFPSSISLSLFHDPVKRRAKFVAVFVVFLVVLAIGFVKINTKSSGAKFSSF